LTIKFICTCGKHLRARDEMAMRRSACPKCGAPVGIPPLTPLGPGLAAPMTPDERRKLAYERRTRAAPVAAPAAPSAPPAPAASHPIDIRIVRLLSSKGQRRPELQGRHLESRWSEFLLYPLRAWHLCLELAVLLTVLSAGTAIFLPRLLADPLGHSGWTVFHLSWVLLLLFGVPCSFLDCVLASAVAGEVYYIRWSGNPVLTVAISVLRWSACFVAGPCAFAVLAWRYWLACGDPSVIDWIILAELGVVALVWWFFALLSVTDRGRIWALQPVAVIDLAHRLGWRALLLAAGAALLLLGHGLVLVAGVALVHTSLWGVLVLAAGWMSGVFWGTFFCRCLGVCCHRKRVAAA
jgi:hypothetical protein